MTRTGSGVARVNGEDTVKFEPTGLVVSSWLQGTSRDGDPQDHIHNQIARMSPTDADGKWRAVDTAGVRAQLGAVRATFGAHLRSEMARRFGVEWVPRKDGDGFEIKGITRAQIERYSTRTQAIDAETARARRGLEGPARRPGAQPPGAAVHPARGHDGQPGRARKTARSTTTSCWSRPRPSGSRSTARGCATWPGRSATCAARRATARDCRSPVPRRRLTRRCA